MRNGIEVYDAYTHVGAGAEVLDPYLASTVREYLPNLDDYRAPRRRSRCYGITPYAALENLETIAAGTPLRLQSQRS